MFCIEAMNGPLDGKRWPFDEAITIGRDHENAQAVLSTDRSVSRRHASVRVENGALFLSDLESSNGTFLDGRPVKDRTAIAAGTPFVVGRTLLRVLEIP
jgi:pSer/pThr/pTyr-binding forkhead associated (FHA) protein